MNAAERTKDKIAEITLGLMVYGLYIAEGYWRVAVVLFLLHWVANLSVTRYFARKDKEQLL